MFVEDQYHFEPFLVKVWRVHNMHTETRKNIHTSKLTSFMIFFLEMTQLEWQQKQLLNDIAILLIEHDMNLVMNVCERIVVLDYGKVIAKGSPEETRNNPDVIRVYLGEQVEPC